MLIRLALIAVLIVLGCSFWRFRGGDKDTIFALVCFIIATFIGVYSLPIPKSCSVLATPKPTATRTIVCAIMVSPPPSSSPTISVWRTTPIITKPDGLNEMSIIDQSTAGYNNMLGKENFNIANSASDNFGNMYTNVGCFTWPDSYSNGGWVVFNVADYSRVTGQLVAIEGLSPADNAIVKMYDDNGTEIASFTGIVKTTLPVDFSIDLTGKNCLKIYSNAKEIMYVNILFYK